MKVADIMRKSLISVSEETPIKDVVRLIFNLGISGVPVVKGKKLLGIVTEQDILSKMYPSLQELTEDYVHARDFESMEKNILDNLETPVRKIMNKKVKTISPSTPIMNAQSLMLVNQFSKLPVVDKNKNLIGIVSQGDIFRQLIKSEIPRLEKEKYAEFIGRYYDDMVNWKARLEDEVPILIKLFQEEQINSILDLGVWTGEYTIALAKAGKVKITGLDHNRNMIDMSNKKRDKLSSEIKKSVDFMLTDFKDFPEKLNKKYDAAVCMGGSLPYFPVPLDELLINTTKSLRDKNAILVLQVLNFEKILNSKKRLLDFKIQKSKDGLHKEHLFIEFFEKKDKKSLLHHVIVFDYDGLNWIYKGITTIDIAYIIKEDLEKALKKAGFKDISFSGNMGEYQGEFGRLSFTEKFDPKESDWLNVVAKR